MEARLLTLENVDTLDPDGLWNVLNGRGVLISQVLISRAQNKETNYLTAMLGSKPFDEERKVLMICLTAILDRKPFNVVEAGWSKWYVRI